MSANKENMGANKENMGAYKAEANKENMSTRVNNRSCFLICFLWYIFTLTFYKTRPLPAFGRQGLDADTRDDSPRACGARRVGGVEWGAPTDLLSN